MPMLETMPSPLNSRSAAGTQVRSCASRQFFGRSSHEFATPVDPRRAPDRDGGLRHAVSLRVHAASRLAAVAAEGTSAARDPQRLLQFALPHARLSGGPRLV